MTNIIKRDKRVVSFNVSFIENAVTKAADSCGINCLGLPRLIAHLTQERYSSYDSVTIEEIVDFVEKLLMQENSTVARAYIEYRRERDIARSDKSDIIRDVRGILDQSDDSALLENANKDATIIPTQRDLVAGSVSKIIARKHILPREIVDAHDTGKLHYHDMDYAPAFPSINCCLVDVKNMFQGFKMGNADIETPKSLGVAGSVLSQIIAQVSSNNYGGTTIDNIDIVMAPYVAASYKKHTKNAIEFGIKNYSEYADKMTSKECFDAFQAIEYTCNTAQTTNGQTPFVTFAFGRGLSKESVMIQEAILKNRIRGIGKNHKTPNFPKLIFYKENGVNNQKGDPNYKVKRLALECSAKRFYPDYISVEAIKRVTGSVKASMGCRSFLHPWTDPKTGLEVHDGRCNLGVVTINLVQIAIESNNESEFWKLLDDRTELCFAALMTRIDRLRGVKAKVAPILYMEGAFGVRLNADDEIMQIFENGRASISLGYIGIHETLMALYGRRPFTNPDVAAKGLEIVQFLKDKTEKWKALTNFGFGLYGTPAENLCYRFARIDREKYGEIAGVTDHKYYTNSFHLDVGEQVTPFEKYDFEAPYNAISNAGFINYAEYPNMCNNIDGLETVIDYTHDNNPYVGVNTPNDVCHECGFEGETEALSKGYRCPNCGNTDLSTMSVIRRICGYLGAERGINEGKLAEINRRVKHM